MAYILDISLTSDDVLDWSFTQDLYDTVEIYELQSITAGASGNTAVYSRAPSTSPAWGKNYVVKSGCAPDDQAQNNTWAGYRYALEQNIFIGSDGVLRRGGELTLKCPGQYNVLDFGACYVAFNYVGARVDFTDYLFWLKSFAFELDADTLTSVTVFKFQVATAAPDGVTYTPPAEPTE